MDRKRHELQQIEERLQRSKKMPQHIRDQRRTSEIELEKQRKDSKTLLAEDTLQADQFYASRDQFLTQAIEMYSRSLSVSDTSDTESTIRLCSLWYANFNNDAYEEAIRTAVARVPSHKFVFLAHQLTARLSSSDTHTPGSQATLQSLIMRICNEHPFHILHQMFSLAEKTNEESSMRSTSHRHSFTSGTTQSQKTRHQASVDIISKLKQAGRTSKRVQDIERLCSACLEWAQYPIKQYVKKKTSPYAVPPGLKIGNIKNLNVPVMTDDLRIDLSLKYENIISISHYQDKFTTAGGINLPKITQCVGNDGQSYKQLVSKLDHIWN
jgi:ataxia telangiectasia mutated family protein